MRGIRWILLPGLDGSGDLFEWFARCRPDVEIHVVRYPANAGWQIDDYVAHADAAIAYGRACVVVAESFSGPIALKLQRRNASVAGVVLVASFVICPNPLLKIVPAAAFRSHLRTVLTSSLLMRAMCPGFAASRARVEAVQRIVRAIPVDVLRARLRLLRDLDERDALRQVDVPLLAIAANHDRLVSVQGNFFGPGSEHVALDGPHFLLQAKPEKCWQVIDE
ncbi:MAG: alpha/beta fold hydrolase [Dokdonella sp.]